MRDNRDVPRETTAQKMVTGLRVVLTWPGRLARAAVTLLSWYGAGSIIAALLRHPPVDVKVLLIAIALFLFGVAFAWPDFIVRAFAALANGYDAAKSRRGAP